jgi:hypothetical protein
MSRSRSTISTFKLFELFPDEPTARKYLEGRLRQEFTFRLNQGNVGRHTTERLDSFVDAVAGKRLTFEAVIRK